MSNTEIDKWSEEVDKEFWSDPEEVRLFEEWLEDVYNRFYDDEPHEGESCTPEPTDVNIEDEELPF